MTTPTPEIPAQYDPAATEREWYQRWLAADAFTADATRSARIGGDRTPFTVVMPPPNVTAVLHVGHGLNNTVQDVVVRWRRMSGDETLWLPGTDHAGIATQNIVEKQLAREGLTRFDVGREAFVARTQQYVAETGGTILEQLRSIGASCDWSRTAYTLSPELSTAVREAFVQLYERGLIYRGHRVIHWCPRCLTSLSDEEAEHHEEVGALYHIRYPLTDDPSHGITVATTRPETMLGDVAVAVHPDDERYRDLVGRTLRLPIANVEIPIIADAYVDPAFGTGAVKITPAHDPNDFEVGKRHALPMPVIMTPDARLDNFADAGSRVPPELIGVDRFEARKIIVDMLRARGELVNTETHTHAVRHCYRCGTVVEPRLSDQWFVRMAPLAAPALEVVRAGRIRILPEKWEAVYVNWLENIRDWNISRQLWWGHRIPVWYCADGHVTVSRADVAACAQCGGAVRQDEDVLDTWFSSWLWPLSTLGWPDTDAQDLRAFYPTDDLVTAPEILFFWVARMVMAGYAFVGEAPFHTVYLHGTVRDTDRRKMSKSLGNGIDPLDVVRMFGADALRYTVISGMGMGADLVLDPTDLERSFAPGRNFATKLWNIGRFLLTRVGEEPVRAVTELATGDLTRADEWILDRLNVAIAECDAAFGPSHPDASGTWHADELHSGMRLNEYAETARRFVWNELADWYLESAKPRLSGNGSDRDVARTVLVHAFDGALRLLHPVVPFITEALWQRLPAHAETDSALLATARWPRQSGSYARSSDFDRVRESVEAIRAMRAEYAVAPGRIVDVVIAPTATPALYAEECELIGQLARARIAVSGRVDGPAAHTLLRDGTDVALSLGGLVDVTQERAKIEAELAQLDRQLMALRGRLGNAGFIAKAPAQVVESERDKEREWSARADAMRAKLRSFGGA